jgi:hypothetical protein
MNTLFRMFKLKPYDERLVDGVVDSWLVFVRANIVSIALCDAVAWAYWAHITAAGVPGYLTAAAAGLIVFFIVASVDASFVMHDTTSHRRAPVLSGHSHFGKIGNWFRQNFRRGHLAILIRIMLVVISFTVTAPFLAQFFFSRDIAAAIKKSNEAAQALKRTEIAASYDRILAATRTRLAARMGDLEKEVAGQGASRRYGDGPTAASIRHDIVHFQDEIRNTEAAKTAELEVFNQATTDELANRYGIDFQREGPDTRARVVVEMEKSPAFRNMRNNVKSFLAFMFLALMTLKFFQPEAVKHYFSAELQSAYHKYESGLYDETLDPRERSDQHRMTPSQFVRWYNDHQRDLEASELLKKRLAAVRVKVEAQDQGFSAVNSIISDDLLRMREDLERTNAAKHGLDQQLAEAESRLAALRAKIRQQEQELAEFRYENDDNSDVSLRDGDFLVRRKQLFDRQLAANRASALATESLIANLSQQLEENRVNREYIVQSMDACGRQARELAELRHDARRRNMEDIASAS